MCIKTNYSLVNKLYFCQFIDIVMTNKTSFVRTSDTTLMWLWYNSSCLLLSRGIQHADKQKRKSKMLNMRPSLNRNQLHPFLSYAFLLEQLDDLLVDKEAHCRGRNSSNNRGRVSLVEGSNTSFTRQLSHTFHRVCILETSIVH